MGMGRVLTWKFVIRDNDGYTLCADPKVSGYAYYWSKLDHDGVQPIVFGDRAQAQSYLDAMRHNEPRNRRWDQCLVEGPFMDL